MQKTFWLLLGLAASQARALAPVQAFPFNDFHCGLDSYHSPLTIQDCYVHDALNVYFDKSAAAEKRGGYTVSFSSKSYSYSGAWSYTDTSNNVWFIARASDTIMATTGIGTASFNVKVATVSANSIVRAVNAFGNIYFVDQTQGVYYWNGTEATYVAGSPKGSLIAEFHGRIWVAGLAIPNGNQLYGSKYLDGTTWTTGPNATDPVQFQVGLNDHFDTLSAEFAGFNDTLYLFKNYSINALYGFDQTDFQVRTLNKEVGCIDQGSVQPFLGGLVFASPRGIEFFDGYTATRISDPLKDKVDPVTLNSAFSQSAWAQSTQADFNAGTITPADSLAIPGNYMTLKSTSSAFADLNMFRTISGNFTTTGSELHVSTLTLTVGASIEAKMQSVAPAPLGSSIFIHMRSKEVQTGGFSAFNVLFSNLAMTQGWGIGATYAGASPSTVYGGRIAGCANNSASGCLTEDVSSTISSTAAQGFFDLTLAASSTGYLQLFVNGSQVNSATVTPQIVTSSYVAVYMNDHPGKIVSGTSWAMSKLDVTSALGSFKSPIHGLGTINSWGNLSAAQDLVGGNIAFSICASANADMSPPTQCAAQPANTGISLSTNAYAQVYSTFTLTDPAEPPKFNSFSLQWYSGTKKPSMASAIYDNRYWLSVATNTTSATNDTTLILSKGPVWSVFSIAAGAFAIFKNALYHGDANATGNVYQDEQGYADNGAAITGYVQTKDYSLGGWQMDKWFKTLYMTTDNGGGSYTVSTRYALDGAPTLFNLAGVLENDQAGRNYAKLPFPVGASNQNFGKSISFTFANSDVNAPMKLYGGVLLYKTRAPL